MTGRHAHRSPLSYPALRPLFENHITLVDHPSAADLYVFAHVADIQEAPQEFVEDWRARHRPVLLLSEEPFWDTIWGGRPLDDIMYVDSAFGLLPVHQLNHHTSNIFNFDHLPYYLLTDHRFANAYRYRFSRNTKRSVQDWQDVFKASPVDVSFMFERRPEPYHAVHWPQANIMGLCAWRTELAQSCRSGRVERLGHSWSGAPDRLMLTTDWHLDKLVRLDGRARLISAVENTHQPAYITEKFFDAFACSAIPIYFASATHRIHELGLPSDSWLNLYEQPPQEAAQLVKDWLQRPTSHLAQTMQSAQIRCLQILDDPATWNHERERLRRSVVDALACIL